ncbi:MAG: LysR family transcriptional regulator [Pseudomonadota bacterium]
MRLEWLEDILAVVDSGSFSDAADQRGLTQSAFSRRIRMIEDSVGVELFDRSRKPVQLSPATAAQETRLRDLASELRTLTNDLRSQQASAQRHIAIVAQHAIATSHAPRVVRDLVDSGGLSVRLRSANLDECYAMLLTHGAFIALAYRTDTDPPMARSDMFTVLDLGVEHLIPVAAPDFPATGRDCVAYPKDAYLGQICERELLPGLGATKRAETSLTTAALELARAGVGFAWVPASLAEAHIHGRTLKRLVGLPQLTLRLTATRLTQDATPAEAVAWDRLCAMAKAQ